MLTRTVGICLLAGVALAFSSSAFASHADESPASGGETTVFGWGLNDDGQLGGEAPEQSLVPMRLSGLGGVTSVAASKDYSLALLANGTVMAWGSDQRGVLGNGHSGARASSDVPVPVKGLKEVSAIATSYSYSLALLRNGRVMAWGSNKDGRLGNGEGSQGRPTHSSDVPEPVEGLTNVQAIAAGQLHALALLDDGSVMAWGGGIKGGLGDGESGTSNVPVRVRGLSEPALAVSAGAVDSLVLMSNGTVMSFGGNEFGQLGNGHRQPVNLPVHVRGLREVTAISAGEFHNLALLRDGAVMSWGWNKAGELGEPPHGPERCPPTSCSRTPVPVEGLSEVSEISAAQAIVNPERTNVYNLARLGDGKVMAWGGNEFGQLGDATTTPSYLPVEVQGLRGVTAVSAGGFHSLAVANRS